jgi:hypothetical protein
MDKSAFILTRIRAGISFNGAEYLLSIWVLANHVFLDPEIDRSIAARDVLNRRCRTARLFQFSITKQLLNRLSSSRVLGERNTTLTRIPIITGIGSPS